MASDALPTVHGSWLFRCIKAVSSATVFCFTVYIIFTFGPWLETRFLPVVGKLQIERMEDQGDGRTIIYAFFNKIRSCEYIGIAWYRGTRDGTFERVPLILMRQEGDESSPNRPVGSQRSGPWIVSIPMEEIADNSFVELSHRCHNFWVTTTEFYP